jgi:hypothetical protein
MAVLAVVAAFLPQVAAVAGGLRRHNSTVGGGGGTDRLVHFTLLSQRI